MHGGVPCTNLVASFGSCVSERVCDAEAGQYVGLARRPVVCAHPIDQRIAGFTAGVFAGCVFKIVAPGRAGWGGSPDLGH